MTFPSEEQRRYLDSSIDDNIYLEACPGSGKTEVIAAKVAREIDDWQGYPGGIALLSFANSAANELRSRLIAHQQGAPVTYPHWVSTIDSFILNCLVAPVAHRLTGYAGKDGDYRLRLVDGTSKVYVKTKYAIEHIRIPANQYDFDLARGQFIFRTGEPGLDRKLNAVVLAEWQLRDLRDAKARFKAAGFATYRDVEHLAIQILQKAEFSAFCARLALRYPLLVIDECQDLSVEQLTVLEGLLRLGVKMHIVGDLNQSIYGFRHADPVRVGRFIRDHGFTSLLLRLNFRSSKAIVDLCSELVAGRKINGNPTIQPAAPVIVEYDGCPSEAMPTFMRLSDSYKNRVIVSRGHSTLNRFFSGANDLNDTERLALACSLAGNDSAVAIQKSLALFGGWLCSKLEYSVKPNSYYCPVDVESELEWRLFLHQTLAFFTGAGASVEGQNWSQWCRAAKASLNNLPTQAFVIADVAAAITPLAKLGLRSPAGLTAQLVTQRLSLVTLHQNRIRLATIHEVKGETHEATMLVSACRRGDQSHWADWISDKNSEAARLAYVASSRPRNLLVWAVKKLKTSERVTLQRLGFEFATR
ncbi:UvrD-helicase domain-containing protein [Pseudomonas putida]|uniref:UvrD-helicase domain-containing protein n=1 Tax=Pseudomonas putida TaxID=303 RepID=UPI0020C338D9|nr:UvrD-helicase domain-containing protein [Pseudomonas putida]UTL78916.1 UvrD-helicase domain-containing protein [Pseudomonas putida]